MKVNECYRQVAQLGFEDSLESDERFVYTLNRALLQVALLRPATRACYIHHDPLTNAIQEESDTPLRVTKPAPLSFIASDVKAFYLEVLGIGSVYLDRKTANGWDPFYEEQFQSNGVYKPLRGFIGDGGADVEGEVRLRIQTGYVCSVCNVAMYRDIYSDSEEEIPAYEAYTAYDVDAMVTDFMGLADPPIEAHSFHQAQQSVYDVENGRVILLARNAPGNYKVTYHHRPNEVTYANSVADDETKIDLDEDLCALLPNLVASYVLLEDDPSMAQYYAALYQAAAQEIRMAAKNRKPVRVVNVTGW
jgi:hypothetical protein